MSIFSKLFGKKVPKYKKLRIEIAEELLNQFLSSDIVKLNKPTIVEFMVRLDFDEDADFGEVITLAAADKVIGSQLKLILSNEYVDGIFLPIIQKSLMTSDENKLKELLEKIKSKKIYVELS